MQVAWLSYLTYLSAYHNVSKSCLIKVKFSSQWKTSEFQAEWYSWSAASTLDANTTIPTTLDYYEAQFPSSWWKRPTTAGLFRKVIYGEGEKGFEHFLIAVEYICEDCHSSASILGGRADNTNTIQNFDRKEWAFSKERAIVGYINDHIKTSEIKSRTRRKITGTVPWELSKAYSLQWYMLYQTYHPSF